DAYSSATENAETALDLSSDMEASGLDFAAHRKLRLSAHLTAGLANYYQGATDPAIQMFRTALDESNNAADVVCLLAQVLWAKGGQVEKGVARDQLFNCVETHPSHVGAVLLLGVIAALDGDVDTMDAVREDLQTLRTTAELTVKEQNRVETVLAAIAAVSSTSGSDNSDTNNAIQTAIMLRPSRPYGWSELATMTGDAHP
ncbi:Superkiller protein 3, partial [Cryomyces antarcticus]